jgi:hypothetical protein
MQKVGVNQNSGVGHRHHVFNFKNLILHQINLNMPLTYHDVEEVEKAVDYPLK